MQVIFMRTAPSTKENTDNSSKKWGQTPIHVGTDPERWGQTSFRYVIKKPRFREVS